VIPVEEHPRVCGEHPAKVAAAIAQAGNTPAYAGNTGRKEQDMNWIEEHPRVCGEHSVTFKSAEIDQGTPPRMRGTHSVSRDYLPLLRNTPAYAGNTKRVNSSSPFQKEHPRVCGEH